MKTFLVRSFVLALALTGFAATTQASAFSATKASVSAFDPLDPGLDGTLPGGCPMGDPTGCGVD